MLAEWANKVDAPFTGLIIRNVFGSFGNPYYHSVIITFIHPLTHNEEPKINVNGLLKLIIYDELTDALRF